MKKNTRKNTRKNTKKIFVIFTAIIVALSVAELLFNMFDKDSRITNDVAEKNEQKRYLTIINNTEQIINKVVVSVGEGTEIESMEQTNPDEKTFSIEIPNEYSEHDKFIVTLTDRHNLKYTKEVFAVKEKGRTEVAITQDDEVEQEGSFIDRLGKWFNGD